MNLLGLFVEDVITGFKGIVTGRAEYLFGCTQYCLVPKVNEKGEKNNGEWFDEGRLRVIGQGVKAEEVRGEISGGPNRDMPKSRG